MRAANIGHAELEVLEFIVEHAPVTGAEVADHFSGTRGLARSTVLTVMDRLRKKGYLTRARVDRVYRYSARLPGAKRLRIVIHDFVQRMLGGSVGPFLAYLSQDAKLTDDELRELRRILRQVNARRKERSLD